MALFCSRYLASPPFDPTLSAKEVIGVARSGYYGSQDYATSFWHHHIRALLDSPITGRPQLGGGLVAAVAAFFGQFSIHSQHEALADSGSLLAPACVRDVVDKFHDGTIDAHTLDERTIFIRKIIETMDVSELDSRQQATFSSLHGVHKFKCPKPHCDYFTLGFQRQKGRDDHVAEHERPFKCSAESCYARTFGFPSRSALEAHEKSQHPPASSNKALFHSSRDKNRADNIWTACATGDLDAVKRHIASGVNIQESQNGIRSGLTPLVIAARKGHLEVCRLLVKHEASVFHAGYKGRPNLTAIGEAVRRCDLGFFWALFNLSGDQERDAFVKGDLRPYIRAAVLANSKEVLLVLLSWYSSYPDKVSFAQLLRYIAFYKADDPAGKESLELILNHEFPKTKPGYSMDTWYPSLVEPADRGCSAIWTSCFRGSQPVAAFLFERLNKDDIRLPDVDGDTPLHCLVLYRDCNLFILKQLLELDEGVSFSIANKDGQKPLHLACEFSNQLNESALDLLLEFGARFLSDEDSRGRTPLHIAASHHRPKFARKLLATGQVDLRKPDRDGRTPFSTAARMPGAPEMMELLLSYDSSLAAIPDVSPAAATPLVHAVNGGCRENVAFLLGLPEADTLMDDSWPHFLSTLADHLTDQLLIGCLEAKRADLAKRVLRDRKLKLAAIKDGSYGADFTVEALNDILPLMFLRQVITKVDLTAEHLETMGQETQRFFEEDDWDADWKKPIMDIDPDIPFSILASFAIHDGNVRLVQLLVDEGHSRSVNIVATDPLTAGKLGNMNRASNNDSFWWV